MTAYFNGIDGRIELFKCETEEIRQILDEENAGFPEPREPAKLLNPMPKTLTEGVAEVVIGRLSPGRGCRFCLRAGVFFRSVRPYQGCEGSL